MFLRILRMSEPSPAVIKIIRSFRESEPFLYSECLRNGFIDLYDLVETGDPETWIQSLTPIP
jgi:hypothetical protein